MAKNKQSLTNNDIEKVQILAITKDGQKLISISDDPILIRCIISWCQFMRLKDELFEQCSLKELIADDNVRQSELADAEEIK